MKHCALGVNTKQKHSYRYAVPALNLLPDRPGLVSTLVETHAKQETGHICKRAINV